jgi:hypothetical protein
MRGRCLSSMENLSIVLEQLNDSLTENNTTSFCLALLEYSGVTFSNGYKIVTQMYYTANIPDIVVKVLRNQNNIFVMECKGGNRSRIKPYTDGKNQIVRCMTSLRSGNGFLVFPQFICHFNKHLGVAEEIKRIDNEKLQELISMIQEVASSQIPQNKNKIF